MSEMVAAGASGVINKVALDDVRPAQVGASKWKLATSQRRGVGSLNAIRPKGPNVRGSAHSLFVFYSCDPKDDSAGTETRRCHVSRHVSRHVS
jgi:hypothetical protein